MLRNPCWVSAGAVSRVHLPHKWQVLDRFLLQNHRKPIAAKNYVKLLFNAYEETSSGRLELFNLLIEPHGEVVLAPCIIVVQLSHLRHALFHELFRIRNENVQLG